MKSEIYGGSLFINNSEDGEFKASLRFQMNSFGKTLVPPNSLKKIDQIIESPKLSENNSPTADDILIPLSP